MNYPNNHNNLRSILAKLKFIIVFTFVMFKFDHNYFYEILSSICFGLFLRCFL